MAIFRKTLPKDHPHRRNVLYSLGLGAWTPVMAVEDAAPRSAEATDIFQAEQLRMAVLQAEQEQLATATLAKRFISQPHLRYSDHKE